LEYICCKIVVTGGRWKGTEFEVGCREIIDVLAQNWRGGSEEGKETFS